MTLTVMTYSVQQTKDCYFVQQDQRKEEILSSTRKGMQPTIQTFDLIFLVVYHTQNDLNTLLKQSQS